MSLSGEISCLSAALCWAFAVTIFRGPISRYGALPVNLFKCLLASAALGLTIWPGGGFSLLIHAPTSELGWLIASAITGIVIGDSALFAAVRRIGGHRTLLLQTLSPVFAIAFAMSLGERLEFLQWCGAAVIMAGILMVVGADRNDQAKTVMTHGGIAFGLLAATGQGAGLVLAKLGMQSIPPVPATFLRLSTAALGMLILLVLSGGMRAFVALFLSPPALRRTIPASFIGTYVAMMLMMAGVALAPASIAAVLLSMPPVFSLGIEAFVDRTRPKPAAMIGTALSILGVALLSMGG